MKKRNLLFISSSLLIASLSCSLFLLTSNVLVGGFNKSIEEDACVTPEGYVELDEALRNVNETLNFESNTSKNVNDDTPYNIFGTISRINDGADNKKDIYIERISPVTRIRSGLYIYGFSSSTSFNVGEIVGFNGTFTNYKGMVEFIASSSTLLSKTNSYGNVKDRVVSSSSFSSFSYLEQSTRVRLDNCKVSVASTPNVTSNTSGYYATIVSNDISVGIKAYARNSSITNQIGKKLVELKESNVTFSISGNLIYQNGGYKIDVGSLSDIANSSSHEHSYPDSYKYDEDYHWKQCSCGQIIDKESHVSSSWIVDEAASANKEGKKHKECTVCGYVMETASIPYEEKGYTTIDIYAFNDTHGAVKDSSSIAGIEKTSTYIKQKKKENPNTIVLSSGDMYQGSMYSNNTKGKLMTEWLNELNCVSMTIGNHEFDWGEEAIKQNKAIASFPFLAINIFDKQTNKRVSYVDASTTFTVDNIKFGLIGAIGDCYSSISGSKVKDVEFKVGDELASLVKEESTRLRNEENCDFIIYSLHGPTSDYQEELSSGKYVDVCFEGHTHKQYSTVDSYGVYHLQGAGYNESFSHLELLANKNSKEITIKDTTPIVTSSFLSLSNDKDTTDLINKYMDEIGNPDEVVGYNKKERSSNELRQKIADLYLETGLAEWGSSYDIVLGGGYLSTRSPYVLPSGNVTISQIYNLFPFDNDIVLCKGSGTFIKNAYVNSTNKNYFTTYNEEKGYSSTYSYSSSSTYYLITDTFGSDYYLYGNGYRSNYKFEQLKVSSSGKYARDLITTYIRNGNYKV